ncbi:hypothetical protein [Chroococcidiopsis sp.]
MRFVCAVTYQVVFRRLQLSVRELIPWLAVNFLPLDGQHNKYQ